MTAISLRVDEAGNVLIAKTAVETNFRAPLLDAMLAMEALMAEPAPSSFQLCHDKENPL